MRAVRLLLLTLFLSSPAWADEPVEPEASPVEPAAPARGLSGRNCLGEPVAKPVLRSLLGIKYGDWGLEHQLRIGSCVPLWKDKGVLFDLSAFEAGFVMHTTPIYVMPGAYVSFAPLSIFSVVVEGAPIFYWPIGLDAAGYYPIAGYGSDYRRENLPAEDGKTALGWYVRFGPNMQLAVPIGVARLIVTDSFRVEHFRIGDAPFYFHNRNDLPAARNEWFIDNLAIVLVEFTPHRNVQLRVGANDQLTMTLGGQNVSNAVRGVVMVNFKKVGPRIRDFMPILALGGRTHHPVRQGDFNFILALTFAVDLSRDVAGPEHRRPRRRRI